MNQVEHLLKTMIKSAEWSSRELMRYFRHLLLPIMDTFMEESQDDGLCGCTSKKHFNSTCRTGGCGLLIMFKSNLDLFLKNIVTLHFLLSTSSTTPL